jgi:hypothetical protein
MSSPTTWTRRSRGYLQQIVEDSTVDFTTALHSVTQSGDRLVSQVQ